MVTTEVVTIEKFGECLKIANSHAELLISLDYGPRVLSYRRTGGENIFLEDTNRKIFNDDEEIKSYFQMGDKWYMYGGHRLWASPEIMPYTYFPDDRTVEYEILEDEVIISQMDQTKNGIRMVWHIALDKESTEVKIKHEITNIGEGPKELAPWSITALATGGTLVFEMPSLYNAYLHNRTMSIWPYTDMKDQRLSIGTKYITLKQDEKKLKACKIGTNNEAGYGAYLRGEDVFIMCYDHNKDGKYPDGNVSFETYTNGFFLEMECLGEVVNLKPGETATHSETWELKKAKGTFDVEDEASIEKFVVVNVGAKKK